jgi:hypothetical protein
MHFMIELAATKSGTISLEAWRQGSQIAGQKVEVPMVRSSKQAGELFWHESEESEPLPVEPDAR